jgi:hypothetical protein
MDLLSISRMPFAADGGWEDLARRRPRVGGLFVGLVLPLSLLAPSILCIAGRSGSLDALTGLKDWLAVATVFFLAEMATFVAMGWLIRQLTATMGAPLARGSCLLAAIAPIPLWLSSLGLMLPHAGWMAATAVVGFLLSGALLFQGLRSFVRGLDELAALGMVQIVLGVPLIGWALLFVFAFI